MGNSEVAVPEGRSLAAAREGKTQVDRHHAFMEAMQPVKVERCARPVPRFMVDMPWTSPEDLVAERIIAKLLSSEDPYAVTNAGETLSGKALVGRKVTVHDVRVSPSTTKGGWGAYLLCDVTVDDNTEVHEVMTIGAKEPVAILSYAWFMGDLPITGTPTVVTNTDDDKTVLGFVVERPL